MRIAIVCPSGFARGERGRTQSIEIAPALEHFETALELFVDLVHRVVTPRGFDARRLVGVGLARGVAALDLRVIGRIVLSWVVTLPVGAGLAALFFFTLKGIFS